ncbi:MAG: hypothetical protein AMXMBFR6_11520 [Betaproteobacteria bacterium]
MGQLRIIAGRWRSRRLTFTAGAGLRPTPDAVRETVFNCLGQNLDGWHCLDLFAGSGALGFEAASRGAAQVVMIERQPAAYTALERNRAALAAEQVELVRGDALKWLHGNRRRFDLVFLDPPYRHDWLARIAPHLPSLVQAQGWVYAEAERPLATLAGWSAHRQGRAGDVHYALFHAEPGAASGPCSPDRGEQQVSGSFDQRVRKAEQA